MKASEAARLFEETAPVEIGLQSDRDAGVLGFRFGDSSTEITGLGVAWYLSMEQCHEDKTVRRSTFCVRCGVVLA